MGDIGPVRRRVAVEKTDAHVEEWRGVAGFPHYEVSSLGRVRSRRRSDWRVMQAYAWGRYKAVELRSPVGEHRRVYVHGLVAEVFIGPRPEGQEIRHLDGDEQNNAVANLAYGTRSENVLDRVLHGTHHNAIKTECKWGHAFDETNTYIRPSGWRSCRMCYRDRKAQRRAERAS